MKDIETLNDKGQWHGYQEWYGIKLWTRGMYKNNTPMGYMEIHSSIITIFYIR